MIFSLIKGGRGGGQSGCTVRTPDWGYTGMNSPSLPYGGDHMQAQYGGMGMGYNAGCPTSPCGGNQYGGVPTTQGRGSMIGDPYATGGDQYGRTSVNASARKGSMGPDGNAVGDEQPGRSSVSRPSAGRASLGGVAKTKGGDRQGRNSVTASARKGSLGGGGKAKGGDRQGRTSVSPSTGRGSLDNNANATGDPTMGGTDNQYDAEAMQNLNCPYLPCPTNSAVINGGYGVMGGDGAYGQTQLPCMECGAHPNPACRPPTTQIIGGNTSPDISGGGTDMTTPCLQCGSMPNPPCIGVGQGTTPALTPCQQCGGLPDPPCGAGTCGGFTPCAECAGNPDAPCLNMGPCEYCPEPPPGVRLIDPDKEVFVLKIGKKREGTDKKPRMELELVTPKAPPIKPMPKFETRDCQYDPNDVESKGKGKGKGKGKKEKGKKKK